MKHLSLLLAFLLLSLVPGRAQTFIALQAGDIALLGQNATGADDFAFTTLVDLTPGTQLKFTDKGWLPAGGFGTAEGGVCVYTVPAAGLAKGAVVRFAADSAGFTHPAGFALGADGDQILAYQGPEAAPTFLYALAYKEDWSSAVAANASALPPGLVADSTAVFVPYLNGAYAADSPHSGTADELSDELNEAANWQGSDAQRANLNNIRLVVLPDGPVYLPVPGPGADSLTRQLHQLFGRLDLRQVPTGYFYEAGARLLALPYYNGTPTDSNRTNLDVLRCQRAQLRACRVLGPDALPTLPAFNAAVAAATPA